MILNQLSIKPRRDLHRSPHVATVALRRFPAVARLRSSAEHPNSWDVRNPWRAPANASFCAGRSGKRHAPENSCIWSCGPDGWLVVKGISLAEAWKCRSSPCPITVDQNRCSSVAQVKQNMFARKQITVPCWMFGFGRLDVSVIWRQCPHLCEQTCCFMDLCFFLYRCRWMHKRSLKILKRVLAIDIGLTIEPWQSLALGIGMMRWCHKVTISATQVDHASRVTKCRTLNYNTINICMTLPNKQWFWDMHGRACLFIPASCQLPLMTKQG